MEIDIATPPRGPKEPQSIARSLPNAALRPATVVLVSAFGRGNALALALKKNGFTVTLVDVGQSILQKREWMAPEDAEGPFGCFALPDGAELNTAWSEAYHDQHACPSGLSLWLSDGPLDLSGPMASRTRWQNLGLSQLTHRYLDSLSTSGGPSRESERNRKILAKIPFRESWAANLAHALMSTRHAESYEALGLDCASPLAAPYGFCQASWAGWESGLKILERAGVTVRRKALVRDLRLDGREVDALEIEDSRAGIERARAFVWLLSGAESQVLRKSVFDLIFPQGLIEPKWQWLRQTVRLEGNRPADALPGMTLMIGDVFLPWSRENMMILRRRAQSGDDFRGFDVWQKLPITARTDLVSKNEPGSGIALEELLVKRMPEYRPKVVSRSGSPASEAPDPLVLHPVFDAHELSRFVSLKAANFFFCGTEVCQSLDRLGQFHAQTKVLFRLKKMKMQWDAAARKAAAKESAR